MSKIKILPFTYIQTLEIQQGYSSHFISKGIFIDTKMVKRNDVRLGFHFFSDFLLPAPASGSCCAALADTSASFFFSSYSLF